MIKKNSQYSDLTTLSDAKEGCGAQVRCRCSCGEELLVNLYALTHGRIKNCGCKESNKIEIGGAYGNWIVLSKCSYHNFLCQNDKGRRCVFTQTRLMRYANTAVRRYKSSVIVIDPRNLRYKQFETVRQMCEAFCLTNRQAYRLLKQHTTQTFPYNVYYADQVPNAFELKMLRKRYYGCQT